MVVAFWVPLQAVGRQRMGESHLDSMSAESGGYAPWDNVLEQSRPITLMLLPFGCPVAQPLLT